MIRQRSTIEDSSFHGLGLISIPLHDYVSSNNPESVRLHYSLTGEKEKKGIALVEISSTIVSEAYFCIPLGSLLLDSKRRYVA